MSEKPSRSKCTSCEAPMLWVKMQASGKSNPLDPEPNSNGNILMVDEEKLLARGLTSEERRNREKLLADGAKIYESHFVSCPNSELHRKIKNGEAR